MESVFETLRLLATPEKGKLPEWIAAIGAIASMVGVWFVWRQVRLSKDIAKDAFEDGLAKEYRELASGIPTKALLGSGLSPYEYKETFDELFRYIDLSNEQVMLRRRGRLRDATWISWSAGINFNMALPAFRRAWTEVQKSNPTQFSELKRLLESDFKEDPKNWN